MPAPVSRRSHLSLAKRALPVVIAATLLLAPLPAFAADEALDEPPTEAETVSVGPTAAEVRHGRMALHQVLGLSTLGSMAVTGGLGLALHNGWVRGPNIEPLHIGLGGLTTALYLTTGTLALTAPQSPFYVESDSWDTVTIHHSLAWLHAAGMASTVGLGIATYTGMAMADWHGLAAATTFGLMGLSAGVIFFGN